MVKKIFLSEGNATPFTFRGSVAKRLECYYKENDCFSLMFFRKLISIAGNSLYLIILLLCVDEKFLKLVFIGIF